MKGVIFREEELDFWKKFDTEVMNVILPPNKSKLDFLRDTIHQTITSYKQASSNGIVWTKEEKELFESLSLNEQRKMIVKKSELKSVLFPYVNVDYTPYTYSTRSKESGKESFEKAKALLNKNKDKVFSELDKTTSENILHFFRIAYKSGNLEAGVNLAKLLFKKAKSSDYEGVFDDIRESVKITKDLLSYNIPENAYHYYALYKWSDDTSRFYHRMLTSSILGLIREEAKDCYNYALECVVWEAIDEEAQRDSIERTLRAAELYLAAAIKYQSPIAFFKAAQNYAPSGLSSEDLGYALIPYNACLRCSIALGNKEALETLISNYKNGLRMMRKNPLQAQLLSTHGEQRKLINGLDPFFDEKFKPEYIIDYGYLFSLEYGGTIVYPGISRLIAQGRIKDPRDSDATKESIKEYYLTVWEMLVSATNTYVFAENMPVSYSGFIANKIYSKLIYGYPSARAYVFPKEILDLKIDFSKGLEGYGVDPNENNNENTED
ncbi:hypothetical protein [Campylobacter coli]|uniref:hypothetical protein n=3 Tax=Campylobacter coli TaxID=195 RepID=UPI00092FA69E|nr:hypothetical protein [Campylobacter coli]HEB7545869.1 hypothetical protein [Campylobacter coli]HEB7552946.1 hypothetical protein [Campylobacter coli]